MLNVTASFFNISSEFIQTFVLSVNKLLNAQHTDEWLIAAQHLMQISAHLLFFLLFAL